MAAEVLQTGCHLSAPGNSGSNIILLKRSFWLQGMGILQTVLLHWRWWRWKARENAIMRLVEFSQSLIKHLFLFRIGDGLGHLWSLLARKVVLGLVAYNACIGQLGVNSVTVICACVCRAGHLIA
jgi:hypothetical protein